MNTNTVIRLLGWAYFTYIWLDVNRLFFNAIADVINHHNAQIRQKAKEDYYKFLKQNSKIKSEDESEVVVETLTETI